MSEHSEPLSISEQLAGDYYSVFRNKDLIEPETIVNEDRIVGRDQQLNLIINTLKPALHNEHPEDMLLRGPSGTGKTLCAGTVANKTMEIGVQRSIQIEYIEVNGKHKKSEHETIHQIAHSLEVSLDLERTSKRGVSTSSKYDRIFEIVNDHLDLAIIVLDELDLLVGDTRSKDEAPAFSDVLYNLTRSKRIGNMNGSISLIVTTNSPKSLMDGLNSRTASTFNPSEISFDDYNAYELTEILEHRRDAFRDGVLGEGVIELVAAASAQGEGDARFAIDLLRESGNIVNRLEEDTILERHVEQARDEVEKNYVADIVQKVSHQKQVSLLATALVAIHGHKVLDREPMLRSGRVPSSVGYTLYCWIQEQASSESRSKHSYLRWMRELSTYEVIKNNRRGRGNEQGMFSEYAFPHLDPESIVRIIMNGDELLSDVIGEEEIIKTVVQSNLDEFAS